MLYFWLATRNASRNSCWKDPQQVQVKQGDTAVHPLPLVTGESVSLCVIEKVNSFSEQECYGRLCSFFTVFSALTGEHLRLLW